MKITYYWFKTFLNGSKKCLTKFSSPNFFFLINVLLKPKRIYKRGEGLDPPLSKALESNRDRREMGIDPIRYRAMLWHWRGGGHEHPIQLYCVAHLARKWACELPSLNTNENDTKLQHYCGRWCLECNWMLGQFRFQTPLEYLLFEQFNILRSCFEWPHVIKTYLALET